jgi:hypothetical protein
MLDVATQTQPFLISAEPLLDGDAGTHQTIQRIRQLVDEGRKDPLVNKTAGGILRALRVRPYDDAGELQAIFAWVMNPRNIRFTKDPDGAETLRPARTILEWGFGDCDDINAILLPSLLATIGVPRENMRLVTIASHPAAPRSFSHVYLEVNFRGRWIPLDAARKGSRFGVEPARQFRKRVWSLTEDSHQDLAGLGGCACRCGAGCLGSQVRLSGLGRTRSSGLGSQMRLGRTYRSDGLGFDWGDFGSAVSAISSGASNIIRASSGQPQLVLPSAAAYPVPAAYGPSAAGSVQFSGVSGTTLLLGSALLLGIVLSARR